MSICECELRLWEIEYSHVSVSSDPDPSGRQHVNLAHAADESLQLGLGDLENKNVQLIS